jgi:hypothetical protein
MNIDEVIDCIMHAKTKNEIQLLVERYADVSSMQNLLCERIDGLNEAVSIWEEMWSPVIEFMQADKDMRIGESISKEVLNRLKLNKEYLEALKEWIEVSPCENGCAENDMTCITQRSRYLIQKSQSKEQK